MRRYTGTTSGGVWPAIERLEDRRLLSADLAAGFASPPPAAFGPGDRQRVSICVANIGDSVAAGATAKLYASADGTLDDNDIVLTSTVRSKSLKPGKVTNLKLKFDLPDGVPDGNYHLLAQVCDAVGTADVNPANDVSDAPSTVAVRQPFVDLGVSIADQPDDAVSTVGWDGHGSDVKVTAAVFNNGNVIAGSPTSVSLYLSADTTFDPADVPLDTSAAKNFKLKPGQARAVSFRFRLPAGTAAGDYHVIAVVDPSNTVAERDEVNNTAVSATPLIVVNDPIGPPPRHYHGHEHYPRYYYGGGYYYDDYAYDTPGYVSTGDGSSGDYVPPPDDGSVPTEPTPNEPPPASQPSTQPDEPSPPASSGGSNWGSTRGDFGGSSDVAPSDSGSTGAGSSGSDFGGDSGSSGDDW